MNGAASGESPATAALLSWLAFHGSKLLSTLAGGAAAALNALGSLSARPGCCQAAGPKALIFPPVQHAGRVKINTGKEWDEAAVVVHTALNFYFTDVRSAVTTATSAKPDSSAAGAGKHVRGAHADTLKVETKLRPFNLFEYDAAAPRPSLASLPSLSPRSPRRARRQNLKNAMAT